MDIDTIRIYQSESFARRGPPERGRRTLPAEVSSSKILVNWFRLEGNHYRLIFDYFIDFSDKQKVILKETSSIAGIEYLKYCCGWNNVYDYIQKPEGRKEAVES